MKSIKPTQAYIDQDRAKALLEKWTPVLDYSSDNVAAIEDDHTRLNTAMLLENQEAWCLNEANNVSGGTGSVLSNGGVNIGAQGNLLFKIAFSLCKRSTIAVDSLNLSTELSILVLPSKIADLMLSFCKAASTANTLLISCKTLLDFLFLTASLILRCGINFSRYKSRYLLTLPTKSFLKVCASSLMALLYFSTTEINLSP